ncbi:hypothetical protein EKO27_g10527 [Xylaria grammica]|uniref:Alpha 1,4-glycosyltransferase domain-containing protein n=1 Tax=Xylaria grammica TaxID=363999 RepID=A0A439CR62_9PEZI|nr:hypothetical protein EKO27_g10527 [Xylaria grammica]
MRLGSLYSLRQGRAFACALLALILLAAVNRHRLYDLGDWVRQTHPGSYQYEVEKDSMPTDEELNCLYNSMGPTDDIKLITNHAHFIFGLSNPYEDRSAGLFDFLAFLAVRSAIVGLKASRIFLYYTYLADPSSSKPNQDPFSNPWINRLKDNITLVYYAPAEIGRLKDVSGAQKAACIADVLRLEILSRQGGIYLDIDAFALRPFTNLLQSPRDIIIGQKGGNRAGLCNAIMVARAGSSFIDRWIAEYKHIDFKRERNISKGVADAEA